MRTKKIALILTGVLILGPVISAAQVHERRSRLMARARESLNRLRLLRMTEVLELNEEQTAKIYPAFARIDREKAEVLRAIDGAMRDLRTLLAADKPDEPALSAAIRTIKEQRLILQRKDGELEDSVESVLTEVQKAKYILFTVDFYRGVAEKVNRARASTRDKRGL